MNTHGARNKCHHPLNSCSQNKQNLLICSYMYHCYIRMRLLHFLLVIFATSAFAFQPVSRVREHHWTSHRIRSTISLQAGVKQRLAFNSPPPLRDGKFPPKLILIAGCPGTGKSTFGMSLALEQGILKCISTDTVRAVMRSYVPESISPPLHRSSYG